MGATRPGSPHPQGCVPLAAPRDSDLPRVAYLGPKSPVPRPVQGEARPSSHFSCTRGRVRRPGWGEGHWDQLPAVPVHARCSRHQGPLSSSRPGRCPRARALVPGRGRTHSPRRRVVGRPCPEGAKRLGGGGRVSAQRFLPGAGSRGTQPWAAPGPCPREKLPAWKSLFGETQLPAAAQEEEKEGTVLSRGYPDLSRGIWRLSRSLHLAPTVGLKQHLLGY